MSISPSAAPDHTTPIYTIESRRPLQVLVFLLPLIVLYELGAIVLLNEAVLGTMLVARSMVASMFGVFGLAGLHLPAILLVTVLLCQHVLGRHPTRVRLAALPVMLAESCGWALPLFVFALVLGVASFSGPGPEGFDPLRAGTVAIGAGLYEELVFRLIMIAGVHALLVDVCGVKPRLADGVAIVSSAVAFAAYHRLGPGGEILGPVTVFYLGSGLLLGWLFLFRGLGIAAGAHAGYDVLVMVLIPLVAGGQA